MHPRKFLYFLTSFFLMLCFDNSVLASGKNSYFLWNQLRYENEFSNNFSLGAQIQLRYSFDVSRLKEEQLNLFYSYFNQWGRFGFIYTIGSENGYMSLRELRYALEYEPSPVILSGSLSYSVRFRQELRNFEAYNSDAFRFRVRNELKYALDFKSKLSLVASSEVNFYSNNYVSGAQGFSSHRTIIGFEVTRTTVRWEFFYVNDYRITQQGIENRHALNISLIL